ncbi:hypothetical protein [Acinetobacter modestus]|uniref:hypothetical protein n=1 Tax=Acinetobacter modestus TaxID=1776740 RepID=UPI00301A6454
MFKVGDKVVFDNTKDYCRLLPNDLMVFRSHDNDLDAIVSCSKRLCAVSYAAIRHATPQEIAAGHRIDKPSLLQYLDKCEEVVRTWPKWKVESIRNAFCIPVLDNDMGDDSHIENHVSKNCKVIDYD